MHFHCKKTLIPFPGTWDLKCIQFQTNSSTSIFFGSKPNFLLPILYVVSFPRRLLLHCTLSNIFGSNSYPLFNTWIDSFIIQMLVTSIPFCPWQPLALCATVNSTFLGSWFLSGLVLDSYIVCRCDCMSLSKSMSFIKFKKYICKHVLTLFYLCDFQREWGQMYSPPVYFSWYISLGIWRKRQRQKYRT